MTARLSALSQRLIGSEILKIGNEVRDIIAQGQPVCNLTVGDFSPSEFRIPERLAKSITKYIEAGQTNYPPSVGVPELRKAVVALYKKWLGLDVPLDGVIIASGGRPIIFGTYYTLLNPGDRVVYGVPSWNNNHYANIVGAKPIEGSCSVDTSFLPTAAMLKGVVRGASLIALNSPSNPTGTV